MYSFGNENTELIDKWIVASTGPHKNLNIIATNFNKNFDNIFNKVDNVWSISNLSTLREIDVSKYNKFCINIDYYIPKQTNTGQGIYWGLTYKNYADAVVGTYISTETNKITNYKYCVNINGINGYLFPFIEIFNDHTVIPYNGYVASTYFYLYEAWLEI